MYLLLFLFETIPDYWVKSYDFFRLNKIDLANEIKSNKKNSVFEKNKLKSCKLNRILAVFDVFFVCLFLRNYFSFYIIRSSTDYFFDLLLTIIEIQISFGFNAIIIKKASLIPKWVLHLSSRWILFLEENVIAQIKS